MISLFLLSRAKRNRVSYLTCLPICIGPARLNVSEYAWQEKAIGFYIRGPVIQSLSCFFPDSRNATTLMFSGQLDTPLNDCTRSSEDISSIPLPASSIPLPEEIICFLRPLCFYRWQTMSTLKRAASKINCQFNERLLRTYFFPSRNLFNKSIPQSRRKLDIYELAIQEDCNWFKKVSRVRVYVIRNLNIFTSQFCNSNFEALNNEQCF